MGQLYSDTQKSKTIAGISLLMVFYLIPYVCKWTGCTLFSSNDVKHLLIFEFYSWVILGCMFIYSYSVERQGFLFAKEEVYPSRWFIGTLFKQFLILIAISFVIAMLVKLLGLPAHSDKMIKLADLLHSHKYLVPILAFTAGATEELLVRGFLFSRLLRLFKNPVIPMIISSIIFSLLHISYGNLSNLLFPLALGLYFSWHYYKYRNIKVLILCHFLWDYMTLGANAR